MSENNIYEIARLMSDPENINNELKEAVNIFGSHLRQKYIDPIGSAIEAQRQSCLSHPTDEVVLLQACRPFIKSSSLDKAIDIFNSINIIQNLRSSCIAQSINDNSIHTDGIYDIDQSCIIESKSKTNTNESGMLIFAVIALLLLLDN